MDTKILSADIKHAAKDALRRVLVRTHGANWLEGLYKFR